MMFGLIVGISCLVALSVIAGTYHYAALQNRVGTMASSYGDIVRLEAFQLPLYQVQNLSMVGDDAQIDGIRLYTMNGIYVAVYGTYSSAYVAAK